MATPVKSMKDEKYEGPSATIVSLGYGGKSGWVGSFIGAAVGAVTSLFTSSLFSKSTEKVTKFFEKTPFKIKGRTAIMAGGAVAGWIIGHYVGMGIGIREGLNKIHEGPNQFNRIKAERDDAQTELTTLKQEIGSLNEKAQGDTKFTDTIKAREATHAEGVEAKKAEAASELTR